MNKAMLIGRPTKNPVSITTQNGNKVCRFYLAVNRPVRKNAKENRQQADFPLITTWNKLADIVEYNVYKGRLISVEGRIQTSSYQLEDGSRRSVVEIIAERIDFLDKNKNYRASTSIETEDDEEEIPF